MCQERIIKFLEENCKPGVSFTTKDISEALNLSKTNVSRSLRTIYEKDNILLKYPRSNFIGGPLWGVKKRILKGKTKFEKAIVEYSVENGIGIKKLRHYLIDGRLIKILKIYDKLKEIK